MKAMNINYIGLEVSAWRDDLPAHSQPTLSFLYPLLISMSWLLSLTLT